MQLTEDRGCPGQWMWNAMTRVRKGEALERGRKAGEGSEDRTRDLVAAQRVQSGSGGHRQSQI